MTRIVAGTAKGRRLRTPRGSATRPTADRVREALFSRLDGEGLVWRARVLDLYAGSGALGLEAASRGAAHVLLVDSGRTAAAACRANVAELALPGVQVRAAPVSTVLSLPPAESYDVVLADPPYDLPDATLTAVLTALVDGDWLADGAVVVVERAARGPEPVWAPGLARFEHRRYGETALWLAEPVSDPEPA